MGRRVVGRRGSRAAAAENEKWPNTFFYIHHFVSARTIASNSSLSSWLIPGHRIQVAHQGDRGRPRGARFHEARGE